MGRVVLRLLACLALAACAAPQTPAATAPTSAAATPPVTAAATGQALPAPASPLADHAPLTAPASTPVAAPAVTLAEAIGAPTRGKAIVVNIPSAEVIALEDGREVLRSRAVVGAPGRGARTPVRDTETSVVRFNPTWRPTPEMIARSGYPDRVTPPGPANPLGFAAIRLDPGNVIYLHGTNRPDLFDRDARSLSSGCVRVERLDELVAWLLEIETGQVAAWAEDRRTFDMPADGVPVLMRYYTRFPDAEGVARDHPDVYGRGPQVQVAQL